MAQLHHEVALPWLVNMRWVAVTGQALTVLITTVSLDLELPLTALGAVIMVTFATNVALRLWISRLEEERGLEPAPELSAPRGILSAGAEAISAGTGRVHPRLLPAVLTLDTLLLTALLALTGGPQNPFAILFVIHVALAAVALSSRWAWWMVGLSIACYALLHPFHLSLHFTQGELGPARYQAGQGLALALVTAVVAYFSSGVAQALRRREKELREARARVARNEWLASLAALAAGTAHELGTPLGTIAVVAKELERAAERLENEEISEDARLIRTQVDRCRRILDRLGALDREGLGNAPDSLDLDELIAHLREDLRARGGQFQVEFAEGLPGPERLHPDAAHAILPLLQNALDAAGEGGEVSLSVSQAERGRLRFVVADRGPGMAPDVLASAQEPFFTTKEHGHGMGLGLYLVRLLSERHDAELTLGPRPGGGTLADLLFPLADSGPLRTSKRIAALEARASTSDIRAALPEEVS